MPLSVLRWSIAILICLLAPAALAGEEVRRHAPQASRKQPAPKQPPAPKRPQASKRLVPIPGGRLLRQDAAAAFERMHSAAREEGLRLRVISGHRTREQQKYLYHLYQKGLGPRAARPGRSNHQRGTAVDVSVRGERSPVYEWLAANACRFGFRRTVKSEPWHWEYRPRTTRAPRPGTDCLGRPLAPASVPEEVARPSPS